ncbi:MAG: hypothetical protein WA738_12740 [Candidatus Angelobacter sp.]
MSPFACDMTALSSEQRSCHQELGKLLRSALCVIEELPDGYEFEFSLQPAIYDALTQITPLEHACCPFFTINIRLDHNKLYWQLTGSEGVKTFIRMEFAAWFK